MENKREHRDIKDIMKDLNSVILEQNKCKFTIDETLAESLGFDVELYTKKVLKIVQYLTIY